MSRPPTSTTQQNIQKTSLQQGGELWVYIYDRLDALPRTKAGGFRTEDARFYAANVVSALEYIHGKGTSRDDIFLSSSLSLCIFLTQNMLPPKK